MIVKGIILFLAILAAKLFFDFLQWKKGHKTYHGIEALIVVALLSPSIRWMAIPAYFNFFWSVVIVAALQFFVFMTIFDGFYNLLRKLKWWYVGSYEGKNDSFTERWQRILGPMISQMVKILGIFVSLISYISILFK